MGGAKAAGIGMGAEVEVGNEDDTGAAEEELTDMAAGGIKADTLGCGCSEGCPETKGEGFEVGITNDGWGCKSCPTEAGNGGSGREEEKDAVGSVITR